MNLQESEDGYSEAEEWDRIYRLTPPDALPWEQWQPAEELVQMVGKGEVAPGQKALDLGCGLGTNTIYLASIGVKATGIDISDAAVQMAMKRALQAGVDANFIPGNVLDLPFDDATFDFLLDRGCFHHLDIEVRRDYVKEVSRVLVPGGRLLLITFRSRISPVEIHRLFDSNFEIQNISPIAVREANTGTVRLFYSVYMQRLTQ